MSFPSTNNLKTELIIVKHENNNEDFTEDDQNSNEDKDEEEDSQKFVQQVNETSTTTTANNVKDEIIDHIQLQEQEIVNDILLISHSNGLDLIHNQRETMEAQKSHKTKFDEFKEMYDVLDKDELMNELYLTKQQLQQQQEQINLESQSKTGLMKIIKKQSDKIKEWETWQYQQQLVGATRVSSGSNSGSTSHATGTPNAGTNLISMLNTAPRHQGGTSNSGNNRPHPYSMQSGRGSQQHL